jgi:signal transduction histidine kinase
MRLLDRIILIGFLTVLGAGVGASPVRAASAAQSGPLVQIPKRILILHDEDKDDLPGLARIDRSLRDSFRSELGEGVEIHSESLALSQFERAGYESLVADYYRLKYREKTPDLAVAVMEPSLNFLLRQRDALFPGVPIVFCGVDASTMKDKLLEPNVTGVLLKRTFSPSLEVALRLQPETRNVFVVGGASTFDRYLEKFVRRDIQPFEGRMSVTYLFGLSMEAWLERLSSLPAQSVILYSTVFTDGAGRRFVPHEALSSIVAAANAPVYVFLDQYVGLGAVGGNVYSLEKHGAEVAALGAQILRGTSPTDLPSRDGGAQIDLFDARQLRRWNLDEARLPPGSIIRHRELSAWVLYRWYIVAAIAVLVSQGGLIGGLLLARARQRRAEAEARRQRDALAHILRVTTLGELTTSLAHEISQPVSAILLNAQAAGRFLARGWPAHAKDVQDALTDITASADRASLIIGRLRALFRKERVGQVTVDVKTLVENVVRLLHAAKLTERIDIQVVFEEELPAVSADAVQLEQVLMNVMMNGCEAIAARKDGSRVITIRARENRPGHLVVEVGDTGIGVKDSELEHIFEQFVSSKPSGLGMGLAISRSIINHHGGRIWATNTDRGLTVHIELPCLSEARRDTDAPLGAASVWTIKKTRLRHAPIIGPERIT